MVCLVEYDFENLDDDSDVDSFEVSLLFKVLRNDLDFFVVNDLLFLYISNHCPTTESPLIVSQSSKISLKRTAALFSVSISTDNIDQ